MARRDPSVGLTEPSRRAVARRRHQDRESEGPGADRREEEGEHRLHAGHAARGQREGLLFGGDGVGCVVARNAGHLASKELLPERPPRLLRPERRIDLRPRIRAGPLGKQQMVRGRLEGDPRLAETVDGLRLRDVGDVESERRRRRAEKVLDRRLLRRRGTHRIPRHGVSRSAPREKRVGSSACTDTGSPSSARRARRGPSSVGPGGESMPVVGLRYTLNAPARVASRSRARGWVGEA